MSSNSTGVTAHILTADWVQMQTVVSGCVFEGHRLSVLVPDEGGVVTQNTGCITGECHFLSLFHCFRSYQHLQNWRIYYL